ncbi:MAG: NDP-sugar synthase [Candidatus Methanomethylophilus sp.]|nr:NDP-sugar synthase [Methanomethylophilus sp.]MDD4709437.1 NDP-sugar synthase [Candidatus Methanomethylophilaceae archaeon]MDY0252607.1 NDP-sugar synthase [Candidatus Methanomethylophilaceae archaeon]
MTKRIDQAVIMVGGRGTRLRPLTETCPKPALPVLDKPCLMYLIESVAAAGIKKVILACGYRSQQLVEAIGDGSHIGIEISYSFEDEPLGTAGAIKKVENMLGETFVAANGDVFADIDVKDEIREHFSSGAAVTMSLTPVDNPCEFGIARVGPDGRISEFKEKPKPEEAFSNLINAGVYVLEKRIFDTVPENAQYDLSKELVPRLMEKGERIQGYGLRGMWRDVGRPSDLIGANLAAAERLFGNENWGEHDVSRTEIDGPFFLGEGSSISDSRSDSSVILKGCRVAGSRLKGSLVMRNCTVEEAEIRDSILGNGCAISPGSVIERSVLGDGTVVAPGTRIVDNEVKK